MATTSPRPPHVQRVADLDGVRRRARKTQPARLTALDAAFMALESPQAPMHLGWAAVFAPPADGPRPTFEALRAHIEGRLGRAPRYRQRLVEVPLGLAEPVWVDDESFDIDRHVRRASVTDLGELADEVMSAPLVPDRPLWELWIAERLGDGHVGVVGKAHHCLVDGVAAVELMALLLDATPNPDNGTPSEWRPATAPGAIELMGGALRHRVERTLVSARGALSLARSPHQSRKFVRHAVGCARAVAHAALPLAPRSPLNGPMSSARHLAWSSRPLDDLKVIERHFGATVNDILLAASAGAVRDLLLARGERAKRLKAMVPVSVRAPGERWGNRVAFVFPGLPCEEPGPARRLSDVHAAMCARKRAHEAEAADAVIGAVGRTPRLVRKLASRVLTSPRLSNLTISNVPGPPTPVYLMGCEIRRAYPVVPLAGGHGISICMTSFNGCACFGVYADARRAADADRLAQGIDRAIDELLARCEGRASEFPKPSEAADTPRTRSATVTPIQGRSRPRSASGSAA
jgi:diacylglycerol O-acyltransferase / wax synthase